MHAVSGEVMTELAQTITPQGVLAVCRFVDVPLDQLSAGQAPRWRSSWPTCGTRATPAPSCAPPTRRRGRGHLRRVLGGSVQQQVRPRVRRKPVPPSGGDRPAGGGRGAVPCGSAACGCSPRTAAPAPRWTTCSRPGSSASPPPGCSATRPGGCPRDVLDLADDAVAVPIYGRAESLNLAAAAAVCLYASARAQVPPARSRRPGGKPDGAVTSPEQPALGAAASRGAGARV